MSAASSDPITEPSATDRVLKSLAGPTDTGKFGISPAARASVDVEGIYAPGLSGEAHILLTLAVIDGPGHQPRSARILPSGTVMHSRIHARQEGRAKPDLAERLGDTSIAPCHYAAPTSPACDVTRLNKLRRGNIVFVSGYRDAHRNVEIARDVLAIRLAHLGDCGSPIEWRLLCLVLPLELC